MLCWSHNTCQFISHITHHVVEKRVRNIRKKFEEHTAVAEPREVVLWFIDAVNTTVSSAIAGNPDSLKKKKKVTYRVPCAGLSNSLKINHPFLSTAKK